ncbi:hypothetical protein [Edaphobacter acidisoli]|nr:hypothetical protein [Edaphobacter acidisoli]
MSRRTLSPVLASVRQAYPDVQMSRAYRGKNVEVEIKTCCWLRNDDC